MVEFSTPAEGSYAYLLGNFNAFNEGSLRMRKDGNQWVIRVILPEGVWYYGFSIEGEFRVDIENPRRDTYRRLSYKFEREVSVAVIDSGEPVFHEPSTVQFYTVAGRTHIVLRGKRGFIKNAVVNTRGETLPMRKKACDELFEYFKAVVDGEDVIEYSFKVLTREGGTVELGPFRGRPYRLRAPDWVFDRVFYQIMPDRFRAGGREGLQRRGNAIMRHHFHGGDLWGVIEGLGHVEELGANAIYLTPIFESMTYHRYDVTDYFRVDGKLGGESAFRELVRELKKRGIRLILDGVFHHTGFFHPYFQDVIKKGEGSKYRDFYRVTGFPVVPKEFIKTLRSDLPWAEKYQRLKEFDWDYESFYSVWLMPRLNHDSPEVRRFIEGVMKYWLEKGADGWRLDVAHGVPPELWREIRKAMPEKAYLVGEVMDDARLWLFDKFHGTMNYPLYELILRFFVERSMDAKDFLNGLELLSTYYGPAEYTMYNFLDNHDTERFIDLVGDKNRYLCVLAFLMTYKGVPSIFYGDEVGLRGTRGNGLDSGRTPMMWDRGLWDWEILRTTKALIRLRKASRALQVGEFIPLKFQGDVIAYDRVYKGERVRVEIRYPKSPEKCSFHIERSVL
nr:glycoside hydrolase family 13 protein [Thermococcus sp. M36]